MFGYVRPNIPNLRVWEKTRYNAFYCGLCHALGREYGLVSRCCLSYDCTFLAIVLCSIDSAQSAQLHRCPFKPCSRKKPMILSTSPQMSFAAGICVLLSYHKLQDDVIDKKPLRFVPKLSLVSAFRKAKKRYPEVSRIIEDRLTELVLIEKKQIASPDIPANCFGRLLKDILLLSPTQNEQTLSVLGELGFSVGRFIYLADAWDDRHSDEKRRLYNPFVLSSASKDEAELIMNISINSAISAYNLLDTKSEGSIVENIVAEGLFSISDKVLNGVTENHPAAHDKIDQT